jgi:HxlR-like helix-turn-helix
MFDGDRRRPLDDVDHTGVFADSFRFDEIQAQTGASSQMLATRLKRLEAEGFVERHAYSQRPLRHEYRLTPMGQDFYRSFPRFGRGVRPGANAARSRRFSGVLTGSDAIFDRLNVLRC